MQNHRPQIWTKYKHFETRGLQDIPKNLMHLTVEGSGLTFLGATLASRPERLKKKKKKKTSARKARRVHVHHVWPTNYSTATEQCSRMTRDLSSGQMKRIRSTWALEQVPNLPVPADLAGLFNLAAFSPELS